MMTTGIKLNSFFASDITCRNSPTVVIHQQLLILDNILHLVVDRRRKR